jgi:hypothetical protein
MHDGDSLRNESEIIIKSSITELSFLIHDSLQNVAAM